MTALAIARERQLDWLLDEVLGDPARAHGRDHSRSVSTHWLAAAIALLALGTAIAVAVVHEPDAGNGTAINATTPPQAPPKEIQWHECHGISAIDQIPNDVVNLKCFDFDDASLAKLARLRRIERLDLSGMDANALGNSVSIPITDAGVAHLRHLTTLRWLSLSTCSAVQGSTLANLRSAPQLEHLDLSSTGVTSHAIATFNQLPSLRSLSLSHCMDFHGRSLADIAGIPGLRRLELTYCPTISAQDALHLAKLSELRHLDLSMCAGAIPRQTAIISGFDDITNGAEESLPPRQDGIGITDKVIAALASLPLTTLKLGGCRQLSDAIGPSLQKIVGLQILDIGNLPKTTTALLTHLPNGLLSLSLDGNDHYQAAGLRALSKLRSITELGLNGLKHLDDDGLDTVLAGKQLTTLRIGGFNRGMRTRGGSLRPQLTPSCHRILATQPSLEHLDITYATWLNDDVGREMAQLPRLTHLDCRSADVSTDWCSELANSRSLRSISFLSCRSMSIEALRALEELKMTYVDVCATGLKEEDVRKIADNWPGCTVRLANARVYRVP